MQSTDTLAQIQASITYVNNALMPLPKYIALEDLEQQTALVHLELLTKGEEFASADEFHEKILASIKEWLEPIMERHEIRTNNINDHKNQKDPQAKTLFDQMFGPKLDNLLDELSPRGRYVIENVYGLNGDAVSTAELAANLGLSESRVKEIGRMAIGKMSAAAFAM